MTYPQLDSGCLPLREQFHGGSYAVSEWLHVDKGFDPLNGLIVHGEPQYSEPPTGAVPDPLRSKCPGQKVAGNAKQPRAAGGTGVPIPSPLDECGRECFSREIG